MAPILRSDTELKFAVLLILQVAWDPTTTLFLFPDHSSQKCLSLPFTSKLLQNNGNKFYACMIEF